MRKTRLNLITNHSTVAFNDASYLVQVRRLRQFAELALVKYPLKVKSISFVNHGENATFKVTTTDKKNFLLRIHRAGYHTDAAIQEEIQWLDKLAKDPDFLIPRPIKSKSSKLVEKITTDSVGTRNFCVFKWIDGRFIDKGVSPRHLYLTGKLIGKLQLNPPKTKHRKYWDAEGLVGKNAKFGSLEKLTNIDPLKKKIILSAGKDVFKKLKSFEKKHPDRMGLIHADVHFGNVLMTKPTGTSASSMAAIDFDDCGYGFFAYDLVMPLFAAQYRLGKKRKKEYPEIKKALLEGYQIFKSWDQDDEEILKYLMLARDLTMLSWLHSRSDNPRLKKYYKKRIRTAVNEIKKARGKKGFLKK